MRKVYIVGGDHLIEQMYLRNGWEVVSNEADADLLQFTGGEDVSPSLYREEKHPATHMNPARDDYESHVYHQNAGKVPMVGICRGGQFLNVMSGGRMWQHVNKHGGTHEAIDVDTGDSYTVTSTHHQMIRPAEDGLVLLTANLSTRKETATELEQGKMQPDIEAVYYNKTNALCYQPHPEYVDVNHPCQVLFFRYLKDYLKVE